MLEYRPTHHIINLSNSIYKHLFNNLPEYFPRNPKRRTLKSDTEPEKTISTEPKKITSTEPSEVYNPRRDVEEANPKKIDLTETSIEEVDNEEDSSSKSNWIFATETPRTQDNDTFESRWGKERKPGFDWIFRTKSTVKSQFNPDEKIRFKKPSILEYPLELDTEKLETLEDETTESESEDENVEHENVKPEVGTNPSIYTDNDKFKLDLTEAYTNELKRQGIDPNYAPYLVAQDILESGWGKKIIGDYNYGNITVSPKYADAISWTAGPDSDAQNNPVTQKFRNFKSMNDYVEHKVNLLNSSRYNAFIGDIAGFYNRLYQGGYAVDPNYVSKLEHLHNQIAVAKSGIKMPSFLNKKEWLY